MDLWMLYVARLFEESGEDQVRFGESSGAGQSNISRWVRGVYKPNKPAQVADFARNLGRNPLEAFVAADMLHIDEAGRGLTKSERAFLLSLIDELGDKSAAAWDDNDPASELPNPGETEAAS